MEWVERLRGRLVAVDTAPLIYFIERHPTYIERLRPFFRALDSGEFRAIVSSVALLEVMVVPYRSGNMTLLQQYREILLEADNITVVPVSAAIAEGAARIRAEHRIQTPDAIHLATALQEGATRFVTNDRRLPRQAGPRIIALDEL